jgi:hypothetical protein
MDYNEEGTEYYDAAEQLKKAILTIFDDASEASGTVSNAKSSGADDA